MKKWLDSPKVIFGILRGVAVAAIALGLWLSVADGVLPYFFPTEGRAKPGVGYLVTTMIDGGLWCIAWCAFFGMCGRLMKGGSAFTQENSRALKTIGMSVALIALVMAGRALPGLLTYFDVGLLIEAVILPGTFLTVGALAGVLSRLLDSAMALEQEQADVI